MNFRRIQGIFLIAFVILDIALVISFFWGIWRVQSSSGQSVSQQAVLLREMKTDSITVPKLSSHKPSGYYISVNSSTDLSDEVTQLSRQSAYWSGTQITSTFNNAIANQTATIQSWLKSNARIAHGQSYQVNQDFSTKSRLVYTQMIDGIPVLDSTGRIQFRVSGQKLTGYTQTYLKGIKVLRQQVTTISSQQAVSILYRHNEIPSNSKIVWLQYGYSKVDSADDQDIYAPIWEAKLRDRSNNKTSYLRVNAITGTIIQTND